MARKLGGRKSHAGLTFNVGEPGDDITVVLDDQKPPVEVIPPPKEPVEASIVPPADKPVEEPVVPPEEVTPPPADKKDADEPTKSKNKKSNKS